MLQAKYLILILVVLSSILFFYFSNKEHEVRLSKIESQSDIYNRSLSSLDKEYILLNFWASWCPPCIEETPSLIRFAKKNTIQLDFIAVSQDQNLVDIKNFIKIFPDLGFEKFYIVFDQTQELSRQFKILKLPETLLYSRSKKTWLQFSGSQNWESKEFINDINHKLNSHFN